MSKDSKQLLAIYTALVVTIVVGVVWMKSEVDKRVELQQPTSTVDIQAFCTEALTPTPEFCTQSTLKVTNNYGLQTTADSSVLSGGTEITGCLVLTNGGECNEY